MKFGKTVASIMAATMAVSALSVGAFAEENKIKLMTAEIPAELATSMVYFDGVGVVDISGVGYDSSENSNADKDANLDVDFDGLGYVSEKNLEAWRDTGVLTFGKLKADFDATGLQWGMFNAKNNYVQLVKRNGEEVTERTLYKITDGEIKKLCDLDTFWTSTREDGISVGVEKVYDTLRVKDIYSEEENYYDTTALQELKLVVTQPDGTRSVKTIAKSNITDPNVNFESEGGGIEISDTRENEYFLRSWAYSVPVDDLLIIGYGEASLLSLIQPEGDSVKIKRYYMDGTEKEIFKSEDSRSTLSLLQSWENGNIFWKLTRTVSATDVCYFYNDQTKEITSAMGTFDEYGRYNLVKIHSFGDKIIGEFSGIDDSDWKKTGFAVFDDPDDLQNYASKTFYKKITDCENNVYLYEALDGKKGYMDGDEKVLAEFDDAEEFSDKYAPVVKGGKAYLVDKNMNVVSEQIDADSVVSVSDNIFIVNKGDKKYFATYEGSEAGETPSTPSKPSTPAVLVDYSDDTTGIKATANEGVIADGAKLSAAAVADKTNDKNFTYEISFKKDDKNVQPNGKVTVKIPVPEALKGKTVYVYRVDGGKYYDMGAKIEDGFVVFETDHFSKYLVTTEKNENAVKPTNPATGIAGGVFGVMAIAGAFVIVSKKRR